MCVCVCVCVGVGVCGRAGVCMCVRGGGGVYMCGACVRMCVYVKECVWDGLVVVVGCRGFGSIPMCVIMW